MILTGPYKDNILPHTNNKANSKYLPKRSQKIKNKRRRIKK